MNDYKKHNGCDQMSFSSNSMPGMDTYYDPSHHTNIAYHEPIGVGILPPSIDPFSSHFNTYYTSSNVFDFGLMAQSTEQETSHDACSVSLFQSRLIPSKYTLAPKGLKGADTLPDMELERQESLNQDTMLSEPVLPAMEGFPDVNEFDQLMHR